MVNKVREPGYYWVKFWDVTRYPELIRVPGNPQVAYWDGSTWLAAGSEEDIWEDDLHSCSYPQLKVPEGFA